MKINNCKLKNKLGFTLIETVVVISIVGLMMPVIFSIFFVLVKQQNKIYRLNSIKKEGDYLINQIENNIRNNAVMVMSSNVPIPPVANKVCTDSSDPYSSGSTIYFLDKNDGWFKYNQTGSTVAFSSSAGANTTLTSSKTKIYNYSVNCTRTNLYTPPVVSLSFDICFDDGTGTCSTARPEESATMHYQAKIRLRNY
jgi:prepilin-type N-terminal cleavage/methylation domain-containing protein